MKREFSLLMALVLLATLFSGTTISAQAANPDAAP